MIYEISGAVAAMLITYALCVRFTAPNSKLNRLDVPNERSLHQNPTARTGGIAIFLSLFLVTALLFALKRIEFPPISLLSGLLLILGVSLRDDWRGVSALQRISIHAVAGVIAAGYIGVPMEIAPSVILASKGGVLVFTALFFVWMINLYNFMDGMDGFAGGMALFGFGTMAILGYLADQPAYALVNVLIAASAAGFLIPNYPPARIFMGDAGSTGLGFLAATMICLGQAKNVAPWWVGVVVFSPFIVDATVTLVRRLIQGQRVWEAHRTHYYQKLVQLGWGHRYTVLFEYLIMVLMSVTVILLAVHGWKYSALGIGGVVGIHAGFIAMVVYLDRKRHRANSA